MEIRLSTLLLVLVVICLIGLIWKSCGWGPFSTASGWASAGYTKAKGWVVGSPAATDPASEAVEQFSGGKSVPTDNLPTNRGVFVQASEQMTNKEKLDKILARGPYEEISVVDSLAQQMAEDEGAWVLNNAELSPDVFQRHADSTAARLKSIGPVNLSEAVVNDSQEGVPNVPQVGLNRAVNVPTRGILGTVSDYDTTAYRNANRFTLNI